MLSFVPEQGLQSQKLSLASAAVVRRPRAMFLVHVRVQSARVGEVLLADLAPERQARQYPRLAVDEPVYGVIPIEQEDLVTGGASPAVNSLRNYQVDTGVDRSTATRRAFDLHCRRWLHRNFLHVSRLVRIRIDGNGVRLPA